VLREHRPDLIVIEVDTEPTGVVVVIGADPAGTTPRDRYDAIVAGCVLPDPQVVPGDVLERRHAVDPERLLGSAFWPALARKHRRGGGSGLGGGRRGREGGR